MPDRIQLLEATEFRERAANGGDLTNLGLRKGVRPEIKAVSGNPLALDFVISTQAVDRDGDTIAPDGWQLKNYLKNPVVLFAHSHDQLPVARAPQTKIADGKLVSRAEFTPADVYPFGHMVFRMFKEGFLNAASVGFMPMEFEPAQGDRMPMGLDFVKQELIEWSAVPVPSNPEALIQAQGNGIDVSPLREWAVRLLDGEGEALGLTRQLYERAWRTITGRPVVVEVRAIEPASEEDPEAASVDDEKSALGPNDFKGTPFADLPVVDLPFNPNGQTDAEIQQEILGANGDQWSRYKKAHLAYAPAKDNGGDPPTLIGAYKLKIARMHEGKLTVFKRQLFSRVGILNGAREGVNISTAAKKQAWDHAMKYYDKLGVPADARPKPNFRSAPDPEEKRGRVLSAANEEKIRKAVAHLQDVLGSMSQEDEARTAEEKIAAVLRQAVAANPEALARLLRAAGVPDDSAAPDPKSVDDDPIASLVLELEADDDPPAEFSIDDFAEAYGLGDPPEAGPDPEPQVLAADLADIVKEILREHTGGA